MVEPPHAKGATGVAGIIDKVPLHPPLAVVVSSHAVKDVLIASWLWQAASVLSVPQLKTTAGAGSTVNVFVQL